MKKNQANDKTTYPNTIGNWVFWHFEDGRNLPRSPQVIPIGEDSPTKDGKYKYP